VASHLHEHGAHHHGSSPGRQPALETSEPLAPAPAAADLQRRAGNAAVNRLMVGSADDRAERDADRAADRALTALLAAGSVGSVQRSVESGTSGAVMGAAGGELEDGASAEVLGRLGAGRSLDPAIGSAFGSALGANVSGARIHTDASADRLARQMSATAFTVGSDVFFSRGAYRPDDPAGAHLLAHELAHVAQQT
jgi:hypothetical protein